MLNTVTCISFTLLVAACWAGVVNASSAKEITNYILNESLGAINGDSITVIVPFGVDLGNLIASFTTNGRKVIVNSVVQHSGITPNDFTGPLIYTVTAEDGSVRNSVVIVKVEGDHGAFEVHN